MGDASRAEDFLPSKEPSTSPIEDRLFSSTSRNDRIFDLEDGSEPSIMAFNPPLYDTSKRKDQIQDDFLSREFPMPIDFKDLGMPLENREYDLQRILQEAENSLDDIKPPGLLEDGIERRLWEEMQSSFESPSSILDDANSVCQVCGKGVITRTINHVMAHSKTHSDRQQFHCSMCARKSRARTDIQIHNVKQHQGKANIIDTMTPDLMQEFKDLAKQCFPKHAKGVDRWCQIDNPRRVARTSKYDSTALYKRRTIESFSSQAEGEALYKSNPPVISLRESSVEGLDFNDVDGSSNQADDVDEFGYHPGSRRTVQKDAPAGQTLVCRMCDQKYLPINLPHNVIRHVDMCHMQQRRYSCSECGLNVSEGHKLESHIKSTHGETAYVIDNYYTSQDHLMVVFQTTKACFPELEESLERWRLNKMVKAHETQQKLDVASLPLSAHIDSLGIVPNSEGAQETVQLQSNVPQEGIRCQKCRKYFDMQVDKVICAIKHGASHHTQKQFGCSACKKAYRKKAVIRMHILRVHKKRASIIDRMNPGLFAAQCEVAAECFPEFAEQIHQISDVYPPPSKFFNDQIVEREISVNGACPPRSFQTFERIIKKPVNLIPVDGSSRRFNCRRCGKRMISLINLNPSASVSQLLKHSRIHLERKQYKCSVCLVTISEYSNANRHIEKSHDGQGKVIDMMDIPYLNELCEEGKASFPYYVSFIDAYQQRKTTELLQKGIIGNQEVLDGNPNPESPDTDTPSTSIFEPIDHGTLREVEKHFLGKLPLRPTKDYKLDNMGHMDEVGSSVSLDSTSKPGTPISQPSCSSSRKFFESTFEYSLNRDNLDTLNLQRKLKEKETEIEDLKRTIVRTQDEAKMTAPPVPNEVEVLRRVLLQKEDRIQDLVAELERFKQQRSKLHIIIGEHQEELAIAKEKAERLEKELSSVITRFN